MWTLDAAWGLGLDASAVEAARSSPDIRAGVEAARARFVEAEGASDREAWAVVRPIAWMAPEVRAKLPDLGERLEQAARRRLGAFGVGLATALDFEPADLDELPDFRAELRAQLEARAAKELPRGAQLSPELALALEEWGVDLAPLRGRLPPDDGTSVGTPRLGEGLDGSVVAAAQWLLHDHGGAYELDGVGAALEARLADPHFALLSAEQQTWVINQLRSPEDGRVTRGSVPRGPLTPAALAQLLEAPPAPVEDGVGAEELLAQAQREALGESFRLSGDALETLFEGVTEPSATIRHVDQLGALSFALGRDAPHVSTESRPAFERIGAELEQAGRTALASVVLRAGERCASVGARRALEEVPETPPAHSVSREALDDLIEAGRAWVPAEAWAATEAFGAAMQSSLRSGSSVPEATRDRAVLAMRTLRDRLASQSGLRPEWAAALTGGIELTGVTQMSHGLFRGIQAELILLTGGRGLTGVELLTPDGHGAGGKPSRYYTASSRSVACSQPEKRILFHEHGHAWEYEDREVAGFANAWLEARALSHVLRPLNDLLILQTLAQRLDAKGIDSAHPGLVRTWMEAGTPALDRLEVVRETFAASVDLRALEAALDGLEPSAIRGYDAHAVGLPLDGGLTTYAGRIYPDGGTEVISVGLEQLCDTDAMASFAAKAPDYFALMVGLLTRPLGREPRETPG